MNIIMRYRNRKFYNSKQKRYTTMREISELLKQGEKVRIICADTRFDITAETLMRIECLDDLRTGQMPSIDQLKSVVCHRAGLFSHLGFGV